jgi:hypothetical protein
MYYVIVRNINTQPEYLYSITNGVYPTWSGPEHAMRYMDEGMAAIVAIKFDALSIPYLKRVKSHP